MLKRTLQILAVFLFLASSTIAQSKKEEALEDFLQSLDRMDFSGIIVIGKDGKLMMDAGFRDADREKQTPYSMKTVFTVGSVTKQFTAAAILKLEMDGKLRIRDPLNKFFEDVPGDKANITIHELLTHSAGFPGVLGDDYNIVSDQEFLDLAWSAKLLFEPGKSYEYSNVGYSLAGMIIEKTTGRKYEDYLVNDLFIPSGMKNTGYLLPEWDESQVAQGYRRGNIWKSNYARYQEQGEISWHLKANGGMLSTAEDMLKWHYALMGDKILSDAAKKKMYTPHVPEPGGDIYYGYGYTIRRPYNNQLLVKHNGGNETFFADFLRFIDDDRVIFVATNEWDRQFADIGMDVAEIIYTDEPRLRTRTRPEKVINDLPGDERGDAMKGFLQLLSGKGETTEIETYMDKYFAEEFIDHFGVEEHVKMIGGMSSQIGPHKIEKIVEDSPINYLVTIKPDGKERLYILEFMFMHDKPLLDGIGIDIEE